MRWFGLEAEAAMHLMDKLVILLETGRAAPGGLDSAQWDIWRDEAMKELVTISRDALRVVTGAPDAEG